MLAPWSLRHQLSAAATDGDGTRIRPPAHARLPLPRRCRAAIGVSAWGLASSLQETDTTVSDFWTLVGDAQLRVSRSQWHGRRHACCASNGKPCPAAEHLGHAVHGPWLPSTGLHACASHHCFSLCHVCGTHLHMQVHYTALALEDMRGEAVALQQASTVLSKNQQGEAAPVHGVRLSCMHMQHERHGGASRARKQSMHVTARAVGGDSPCIAHAAAALEGALGAVGLSSTDAAEVAQVRRPLAWSCVAAAGGWASIAVLAGCSRCGWKHSRICSCACAIEASLPLPLQIWSCPASHPVCQQVVAKVPEYIAKAPDALDSVVGFLVDTVNSVGAAMDSCFW